MSQNYGDPKTGQMVTLMDNEVEIAGPVSIDWIVDVSVTNDVGVNVLNTVKVEWVDGPLDVNVANPVEVFTTGPIDVNVTTPLAAIIDAPIDIATMPDVTIANLKLNTGGAEGIAVIDIPSSVITTTSTSASIDPTTDAIAATGYAFVITVTSVTGTTPTLDAYIEESVDGGTNWKRVYSFERIIANAVLTTPVMRSSYGTAYRYVETVGGTGPSFTRSISRIAFQANCGIHRQYFDRTINTTVTGSTTPITWAYLNGFDVDGCLNHQLVVSRLAGGGNVWFVVDGSLNGVDWFQLSPATLTVGASATATQSITALCKYMRVRTTSNAAGSVINYVCIKSLWIS